MSSFQNPISNCTNRTEFQCYLLSDKVFDITEKRLLLLLKKSINKKRQKQLVKFLNEYKQGIIKIAWKDGEPIFSKITTN